MEVIFVFFTMFLSVADASRQYVTLIYCTYDKQSCCFIFLNCAIHSYS